MQHVAGSDVYMVNHSESDTELVPTEPVSPERELAQIVSKERVEGLPCKSKPADMFPATFGDCLRCFRTPPAPRRYCSRHLFSVTVAESA